MTATNTALTAYEAEIEQWHQKMHDGLVGEAGWLSLVGLYWLHTGNNSIGANPDGDVVLNSPQVPAQLGVIELADDQLVLRITADAPVLVDGVPATTAELRDDYSEAGPSLVQIGSITFFVIRRGREYAIRVRDANAPARLNFAGRKWFPLDQAYQVDGVYSPHETPRTLQVVTSSGNLVPVTNPGRVTFALQGQQFALEAFTAGENELWFVFKDATSGKLTYGAGRFMYAPLHPDGTVSLDFNKAYHPPCAFTAFATCPFPPKENALPVEIPVGERS